ncbi:MAG: hypothetical protein B7733_16045 [Myxococcales bacterium FL481]|nr:MAG: hypothetical protein B7733_16045 [Myxococcales bacterium FL481]
MQQTSLRASRRLAPLFVGLLSLSLAVPACGGGGNERWVTTENAAVDIDWDAVGEAYKSADGPEDLERRVNEIYTGDEIISVSVQDADDRSQVVTGFFDNNTNGKAEESEKIFSIKREVAGEGGQYQISGHGMYSGYHSPMWSMTSGMLMGAMMANMFAPSYRPMYATPYVTPASRRTSLATQRNNWRKSNPGKFNAAAKKSRSGRSYGAKGKSFGGGRATPTKAPRRVRMRGGGRFGSAAGRGRRVVVLS